MKTPHRLRPFGPYGEIGEFLPPRANVLVHESPLHLGLNTTSVQDQWQGRISYAELQSPGAIYRELQSLRVTHILWANGSSTGWNCLGHDLGFWNFVENYATDKHIFGHLAIASMPAQPPPDTFNDRVAALTCGGAYARGWYRLGALRVPQFGGPLPSPDASLGDESDVVDKAGFIVTEPRCANLPDAVTRLFHPPASRGPWRIYVRRTHD